MILHIVIIFLMKLQCDYALGNATFAGRYPPILGRTLSFSRFTSILPIPIAHRRVCEEYVALLRTP